MRILKNKSIRNNSRKDKKVSSERENGKKLVVLSDEFMIMILFYSNFRASEISTKAILEKEQVAQKKPPLLK